MQLTFASCRAGTCTADVFMKAKDLLDGHLRALLKKKPSCITRTSRAALSSLRHRGVCPQHRQEAMVLLARAAKRIEAEQRARDVVLNGRHRQAQEASAAAAR